MEFTNVYPMPPQTRILLVDDNAALRAGIRALLKAESTFIVVGEAGDGEAAVSLAAELAPDVILMDVQMPGMNGIEATRRIMEAATTDGRLLDVLAFSASASERQAMLDAGAVGFVLKDQAHDVANAIRKVSVERRTQGRPELT